VSWLARLRPAAPALHSAARYRNAPANVPRTTTLALDLRHAIARHRRPLAAICAAIAIATALSAITAKRAAGVAVITAARDLPIGTTLTGSDLRTVALPAGAVPAGAITTMSLAVGRSIASPVRRGEPLTDVRLANGPLGTPAPGMVAAPVRLSDAEAAELLQPGQRVDVLAASTSTQSQASQAVAAVVAADVQVVAIPTGATGSGNNAGAQDLGMEGALVVLATTPAQARALAQAQVSARLSAIVVR